MSNKTFDRLKWFALIFVPALVTFFLTVGKIWVVPYYEEIGATIAAFGTFLGACLGVSSYNYYESMNEGESDDDTGNDGEGTTGEDC